MNNTGKKLGYRRLLGGIALALPMIVLSAPVLATNSWNGYHWPRSTTELLVQVGDNVSAVWDPYLVKTNTDWNASTVINSPLVPGSTNPKQCRGVAGTIQVCSSAYGRTGWLGIATISISGSHITQGTTKLNDTYFNTAQYNTPAWRQLVTCQEVGHDYGLAHQDENFYNTNLGTCMDYTDDPDGTLKGQLDNRYPNAHDYQQLLDIYNHLEAASASIFGGNGAAGAADTGDTPAEWGRAVHYTADGRPDLFERIDGPGRKTLTHVFWALGEGPRGR